MCLHVMYSESWFPHLLCTRNSSYSTTNNHIAYRAHKDTVSGPHTFSRILDLCGRGCSDSEPSSSAPDLDLLHNVLARSRSRSAARTGKPGGWRPYAVCELLHVVHVCRQTYFYSLSLLPPLPSPFFLLTGRASPGRYGECIIIIILCGHVILNSLEWGGAVNSLKATQL